MKKATQSIAALFSTFILLNSCTIGKNSVSTQKDAFDLANEPSSTCFVQLNDGSIQQYKTLTLVTGVLTTPHLLADGKEVIDAKKIMAYQNDKHYAVSPKILTSKKNSLVAVETLPGFAIKRVTGKISIYSRKFYNGANTADEYFVQNGEDGFIVAYSKDVLKNLLKEDVKALDYFNNNTKAAKKSAKLLTAVEMYNNKLLMTKN